MRSKVVLFFCALIAPTLSRATDPASRIYNFSILAPLSPPSIVPLTMGLQAATPNPNPLGHMVLFRAVGPSLAQFGITGYAEDPALTVFYSGQKVFEANDDDDGNAVNAGAYVGAFPLVLGGKDAGFVTSTAPGAFTVQITGHGSTGLVLGEVYENVAGEAFNYGLDTVPQMVNVSALSYVPTHGASVVGLVLGGTISRTALVRVAGPSLAGSPFALTQAMPDPQIVFYNSTGPIGTSVGWAGSPALSSAATAVGAFPFSQGSKDAAMLVTLQPGAYTFTVSSVSGTAGLALAEVYLLP